MEYKYDRIECFGYNGTPDELEEYLNKMARHRWRVNTMFRIDETRFEILFERPLEAKAAVELLAASKAAPLEPESYAFPIIRAKDGGAPARKPWWRIW